MFAFLLCAHTALGHGNMAYPPTWQQGQGNEELESYKTCSSGGCMWFNNYTSTYPHEPTLAKDSPLRTYPYGFTPGHDTYYTPWWAPGRAGPIHSPCGVYGGNPYGCPAHDPNGKDCPGGGSGFGPDAREWHVAGHFNQQTTVWEAGSIQDVMWNIKANHGGGYAYRLCKVPPEGVTGVDESCFQQGHLEFAGDKQWAQWGPDFKNRTEFAATQTKTGTWPPNSPWRKNPVPACRAPDGGVFSESSDDCELSGFQFEPPAPGVHGYGEYIKYSFASTFGFNIVDKVQIPENLVPGKYILSFRWDCEQTPQVWNTCADIEVVGASGDREEAATPGVQEEAAEAPTKQMPQKVLRTLDYANGL